MSTPFTPHAAPRRALTVLVVVALLLAGCGHSKPHQTPPTAAATQSNGGTMARASIAEHLVVTATVDRVLSTGSFVLRDVDLPAEGLLVLTTALPQGMGPAALVEVHAVVIRFHYSDNHAYVLGAASLYTAFEGKKSLAASDIRLF